MLQFSEREITEIQKLHYERFRAINPMVEFSVWENKNEMDDRWGGSTSLMRYSKPVLLYCDFNWDRKIKEHINGVWIRTNKIELLFPQIQLKELNIKPKLGDLVIMQQQKHKILSVEPTNLINGTQFEYLELSCIIDTKETTTD